MAQTILATTNDGDFKENSKDEVFDTDPKSDAASKSVTGQGMGVMFWVEFSFDATFEF